MNKNQILKQEQSNDGKSVYLYYDRFAGLYLAFGLSAYYATMAAEPKVSYSVELQMPVALLSRYNVLQLRQGLTKVEHKVKEYYKFTMKRYVGNEGYERWKEEITAKYNK